MTTGAVGRMNKVKLWKAYEEMRTILDNVIWEHGEEIDPDTWNEIVFDEPRYERDPESVIGRYDADLEWFLCTEEPIDNPERAYVLEQAIKKWEEFVKQNEDEGRAESGDYEELINNFIGWIRERIKETTTEEMRKECKRDWGWSHWDDDIG